LPHAALRLGFITLAKVFGINGHCGGSMEIVGSCLTKHLAEPTVKATSMPLIKKIGAGEAHIHDCQFARQNLAARN
jgi:hypothetical protein